MRGDQGTLRDSTEAVGVKGNNYESLFIGLVLMSQKFKV